LTFYEQLLHQYSLPKNYKSQTVIRKKLRKTLLFLKAARKMLMKLTPAVNYFACVQLAPLPTSVPSLPRVEASVGQRRRRC